MLCYKDYVGIQGNQPLTPAEFNKLYNVLPITEKQVLI